MHNLVCSFKRVCRFLKLLSLATIWLSFSLRCFVHDLYQSYPQIFQPIQKWFLSWFYRIQEHMERKFVWKTTLVLFWSSIFINKFVQLGVLMADVFSNYYPIHYFVSFTSCLDLDLYHLVLCRQLLVDLNWGFSFRCNLKLL